MVYACNSEVGKPRYLVYMAIQSLITHSHGLFKHKKEECLLQNKKPLKCEQSLFTTKLHPTFTAMPNKNIA